MKASFSITKFMVKVFYILFQDCMFGATIENMKDNGKIIRCMDME
jgi:hypothetical protein